MSKQQKDHPEKRPGQPDTERDAPRAGQQHQNEQSRQQHGGQPRGQQSPQPGSQQPGSQQRSGQHRQDDLSQGNRQHGSGSMDAPRNPQEQRDRAMDQGRNAEQRQKDKP